MSVRLTVVCSSMVLYADVAMIGGHETAHLVNLMDEHQAAVVGDEPGGMILFVEGGLFYCALENRPWSARPA